MVCQRPCDGGTSYCVAGRADADVLGVHRVRLGQLPDACRPAIGATPRRHPGLRRAQPAVANTRAIKLRQGW